MVSRRNWLRFLGPLLAGLLLLALVLPEVWSELLANLERVQALRGLDLTIYERSLDEAAWDSGWRGLCGLRGEAAVFPMPTSDRALEFSALASIDRGEYLAARKMLQRLVDQGNIGDEPNAVAYTAALEMDWTEAARAYEPQGTARHERWWGTVFYLAAQQRMFEGELDQAAKLYRRADAAYGVRGPYLGLGLVNCLDQQGRPLEAWDAYRRALAVLPPEEALTHLSRFVELRLAGLRAWQELQPENEQVAHWLGFYEEDAQQAAVGTEMLIREPVPQVSSKLGLDSGRTLLGFDYRVEDMETGPFMVVDFYLRDGQQEPPQFWRVRQTVLNQAPNGAFAWDGTPDGVRPVGWHGFVYDHDLAALYREKTVTGELWLCLDAGRIGTSFGLQGNTAPLHEGALYVQGGKAFPVGDAALSVGRIWFGVDDPYNYSYVGGGRRPDEAQFMAGIWEPVVGADSAAVWLVAHQTSKACFQEQYLFSLSGFAQDLGITSVHSVRENPAREGGG